MDMKSAYKKSLQMIKERNINNIKDYTILAKEENLLSALSLQSTSRKDSNSLLDGHRDSPHA